MEPLPAAPGLSRKGRWAVGVFAALTAALAWKPLAGLLWQLALGLILAALALPLCRKAEKRLSRPWAAGCAAGALTVGILGLMSLTAPAVVSQIGLVIGQAPRLLDALEEIWSDIVRRKWVSRLGLDPDTPRQWIGMLGGWIADSLPHWISRIGAGVDALSRAVLSPVLAFYFLRDRDQFSYQLSLLIPARYRRQALTALQEMRKEAGGYLRGQTLVALAVAALTAAGLFLVGTPAWLVLGILMGLCEFIPYVGPLIGGVPIALFSLPQGMETTLWALGVTILVQQIEGYILSPRLMGSATGLHPVFVLALLSFGGAVGGLAGMMAALPAFVCLRGAYRVLWEFRKNL